jgi:hypothetical protein
VAIRDESTKTEEGERKKETWKSLAMELK